MNNMTQIEVFYKDELLKIQECILGLNWDNNTKIEATIVIPMPYSIYDLKLKYEGKKVEYKIIREKFIPIKDDNYVDVLIHTKRQIPVRSIAKVTILAII